MYTNEHMTLWRELISKYESSLLFIAEAAHQLVHIVQFELPHLRRTFARMEQQVRQIFSGHV
jgi:hypothetical protein